jgi:hypothetical protein
VSTAAVMKKFFSACALAVLLSGCESDNVPKRSAELPVRYHNAKYGLTFALPAGWRGYSLVMQEWVGRQSDNKTGEIIRTERGPEIVLRHPKWTASNPRQDIPIRVFTRAQWEDVHQEIVWIDAGGTTDEICHNRNYVFGVHGRFNWGEATGWEETSKIVDQNRAANGPRLYPE